MLNRVFAPAILLALLTGGVGLRAETLLETYRLAIRNDPVLRAADADRRSVIESKNQNVARLFPTIAFEADTTANRVNTKTDEFDEGQHFNSRGYRLNLTQPLYRRDLFLQLEQADSRIAEAQFNYSAAEQDLIIRVIERYTDILAAIDNLVFVRAEKEAVNRQLDQTQQRFEVGLIAITDVHDAQAAFDTAVAEEILAENLLDNAYDAMAEITGVRIKDVPFIFKEVPLIRPDPEDIDSWVNTANRQNLVLQASRSATQTARQEIEVQRSGHLPTLDIVATAGHERNSGGGAFSQGLDVETDDRRISLQLNVPLYQGGLISSQVREAVNRLDQSRAFEEQQRRSAVRQTRDAYLGVLSSISRVKALEQRLVSTESALEATEAGYEVGTRTIVDVLGSQRDRLQSRRDLSSERYEYIRRSTRLKQAAGLLIPADVEQVDAWLR